MTEGPEYFLIGKREIEMLDTIGAIPHNALIGILKGRPLAEHDAAIAQAAREDERKRLLADDCNYRITTMIDGGSRVYVYPGGILPKQPIGIFEISVADRGLLYKTIESLRSTVTKQENSGA